MNSAPTDGWRNVKQRAWSISTKCSMKIQIDLYTFTAQLNLAIQSRKIGIHWATAGSNHKLALTINSKTSYNLHYANTFIEWFLFFHFFTTFRRIGNRFFTRLHTRTRSFLFLLHPQKMHSASFLMNGINIKHENMHIRNKIGNTTELILFFLK